MNEACKLHLDLARTSALPAKEWESTSHPERPCSQVEPNFGLFPSLCAEKLVVGLEKNLSLIRLGDYSILLVVLN
jgi:hypothetical protein